MVCPNCGTDHGDRQLRFCLVCGSKMEVSPPPSQQAPVQENTKPTNPVMTNDYQKPADPAPKGRTASVSQASQDYTAFSQPANPVMTNDYQKPTDPVPNAGTSFASQAPQDYTAFSQPANPVNYQKPAAPAPKAKAPSGSQVPVAAVAIIAVLAMLIVGGIVLLFSMQSGEMAVANPPEAEDVSPEQEMVSPEQETVIAETLPALVPNCVGMYYSDVEALFATMGGTPVFESVFSDVVEEGYVIEQSIPGDSAMPESGQIVFTVSKGPDVAPEGYNQKVVVSAAEGSSYATMVLYEWENGQWVSKFTCDATVGKKGIAADYGEGRKKTPMGIFKLGVALSANSIPNDNWPYRRVTSDTCVVDDTASVYYNTIQSIRSLPYGVSYDPIGNTLVNGYSNICIYIEHNGDGLSTDNVVPGLCSVITICGRSGAIKPTAGCVDISASDMNTLIRLLAYDKNPHIEIVVV